MLATKSPNRDNHALNKGELERAIAGKRNGVVQEAYVVAANLNGGGPPTYDARARRGRRGQARGPSHHQRHVRTVLGRPAAG